MKLKSEQLAAHLERPLLPVYLLCGDEPLLMLECADQIRACAKKQGFIDREVFHVEPGFSWDQVLASANSLSLFAEQKFLDIRLSGKPNEAGVKALLSYAENPPADTLMLITAPKLDNSTLKVKWASAIEKNGAVIQLWPMDSEQLPRWLHQRARQLNLRLSDDAAQLLAQRVAGNLLAATQELNLLSLLSENGQVSAEDILDSVGEHARHDVYDLVRVAFMGKWPDAVRILEHLKQEGAEPTLALWALTRELRDLIQLLRLMRDGQSFEQACKQARIWPMQRQAPLKLASRRCRPPQLLSLLDEAQALDVLSKSSPKEFWHELSLWIAQLCGQPLPLPFASKIARALL
ncbi:DNA polymerase III subunit delta [Pokkaliibacter sp. CJK22405]|uniref:DNA polymerase III subunit delta n=1 Tax=Pokkaliibacter sp. CJK22405 TaxID=3384615 RepID=UPI003984C67E